MSHPHDPVILSPVAVDRNGCIRAFGLRFWSSDLHKFSGCSLQLCVAAAPHMTATVVSMHGEKLCEVDLIDDTGFADLAAAELRSKRERKVIDDIASAVSAGDQASVIGRKAASIAQFSDDHIKHVSLGNKILRKCRRAFSLRLFDRRRAAASSELVYGSDMGDQAAPRAHSQRLEHIQALLKHVEALIQIERHGLSPSSGESSDNSETGDAPHRLYEGSQ